jgi:hypothetical protein
MASNEENAAQIIPDFFAEFIGRITPGLVVIALAVFWSGKNFKAVFSSVELSVFVLAAAWIIGITLDMGIFCIGKLFYLDRCEKLLPPLNTGEDYWKYILNAKAWERGIINKQMAQLIFFRNMMSICALMALISIAMNFPSSLNFLLPVLDNYHQIFGILGSVFFFVFGLCWQAQRETIRVDWKEVWSKKHTPQKSNQAGVNG